MAPAAKALQSIDADLGGTEMENALAAVFALDDRLGGADVLVITDGEVWGADSLLARARAAQQRVFVVGIGSAPAEGVLRKLAVATGGACEFVAPNEGVQQAILRTFLRMRAPRVERAEIAWPGTPTWVTPLPQGLFGGETLHAYAGLRRPPQGAATLTLVPTGRARRSATRWRCRTRWSPKRRCREWRRRCASKGRPRRRHWRWRSATSCSPRRPTA
ncbi:MAG: hypothetical protein IPF60_20530 [Betaproteobacteria bacterium]|nr:hypothetical protein [Betaproteobacteria bacterium]